MKSFLFTRDAYVRCTEVYELTINQAFVKELCDYLKGRVTESDIDYSFITVDYLYNLLEHASEAETVAEGSKTVHVRPFRGSSSTYESTLCDEIEDYINDKTSI